MNQLLREILNLTSNSIENARMILKITQEIKTYIDGEEMESISRALTARQTFIDEIEKNNHKIDQNISVLEQQYSIKNIEDIDQVRYPQVQTILNDREQIQSIYKSTYELESQNQKKVQKLMEQYKTQIKNINQGKQAYQAYGRRTKGYSIMLDQFK